jgi:hypothetical protein
MPFSMSFPLEGNSFVIDGLVKKSDNSDNSAYALYNLGGINNLTLESSAGITATASDTLGLWSSKSRFGNHYLTY